MEKSCRVQKQRINDGGINCIPFRRVLFSVAYIKNIKYSNRLNFLRNAPNYFNTSGIWLQGVVLNFLFSVSSICCSMNQTRVLVITTMKLGFKRQHRYSGGKSSSYSDQMQKSLLIQLLTAIIRSLLNFIPNNGRKQQQQDLTHFATTIAVTKGVGCGSMNDKLKNGHKQRNFATRQIKMRYHPHKWSVIATIRSVTSMVVAQLVSHIYSLSPKLGVLVRT